MAQDHPKAAPFDLLKGKAKFLKDLVVFHHKPVYQSIFTHEGPQRSDRGKQNVIRRIVFLTGQLSNPY